MAVGETWPGEVRPPPGKKSATNGYHSGIVDKPDVTKWVQVDLGRELPIKEILLHPCFDNFNQIGAGFGFPLRYRVEVASDPEFHSGVTTVAAFADADVPNPGTKPQSHSAGGVGRYVRVTATKLAPRSNDFIFALADSAFAFACNTTNQRHVAAHCDITYLRPARMGDHLVADAHRRAEVGRSAIYDVSVATGEGVLIAEFRGHARSIGAKFFEDLP
jgi:phenylacetic acid degradation protein PaaD